MSLKRINKIPLKHKEKAIELGERRAYAMCRRKRKLKSSEAGRLAGKYNQRKYECPICNQWHLTKQTRGK